MILGLYTYTKALFITLQNKLTMINDYGEKTLSDICRENFSKIAKKLKRGIKSALRCVHSATEKFTKQLEFVNYVTNIEFDELTGASEFGYSPQINKKN